MSFHSPHLLWLLAPLILLFSWELARHSSLGGAAPWPRILRAWAGAFEVSLGRRHSTAETRPRIWIWFGLACCIVAVARPQWGVVEEQVFDQSREVLLAVDLSKSMLTTDVKPSRLERAKLLIGSLLDRLKGERVGLVLFSGTAFLQSPLSADYEVLREFLPALKPDYLPEGGSNYRAMLETSIAAFGTSTADRYLIILSDGESTEEGWQEMRDRLREKGIRVIGLGIGTAAGSFIPDEAGGFVKDERGAVVLSRLNSSTLQDLAQVTNGAYTDASSWVDLPALLRRTVEAGRKGEFSEKNTARLIERYQWFLAPGLLLLLASFWAEFPVRPRERALPLARAGRGAAVLATAFLLAAAAAPDASAQSQPAARPGGGFQLPAGGPPVDTAALTKPLSAAVSRLSGQDALSARDCAELAQTTLDYGHRMQGAGQQPVAGAVHDALAAVDLGELQDAKAADWPRLRRELQELLREPEQQKQPQKQQDQSKQDQQQQKQDQQDQPSSDQQQKQDQDKQQQQQDQKDQSQQDQQQQQKQQQSAFGDMKDQQQQPKPERPQPDRTQKVGGQQEKKPSADEQKPELALPLQKLDQVRDQDSPAKLYRLMEGKQKQPVKPAKDW